MRKHVKLQLTEDIELLRQANAILKKPADGTDQGQIHDLLAQEQEMAISIGNRVEETEGEGTEVVTLLEQYCEQLWYISQEIKVAQSTGDSLEESRDCEAVPGTEAVTDRLAVLDDLLEQVGESLEKLPRQLDVVFLPYKASMWDCMESVWMAADADPDCTCYVIPIPYCDINQDGTIGEIHYEGGQMPSYVPVTHYEKYNIAENRPDTIYIHNPYDGTNLVTRVASDFYSEELKKYTDMLVYIPYYIGTYHLPEEHKLLSAYLHADKIILQNETMVEEVKSVIPREKLVAMGNPKADRILRLEGEKARVISQMIPKAWKKKIRGRKVVLYNVSISGILEYSEQALDKICYVLSRFEDRDDVVLLWRPHPLIEGTLRTMRPALYEGYMQIKREFQARGKGILDESADAGVAAVVADAYVGESSSSLVNYFGVLGKPVFFTDWKVTEELTLEERKALPINSCFCENGNIYFTVRRERLEHSLFRIDRETGKTELVAKIPGSPNTAEKGMGYCDIAKIDEWIVLPPSYAEDVLLYNSVTKETVKLVLNEPCQGLRLDRVVEYNDKVFLLPKCYPAIIECNAKDRKIVEHKLENIDISFGDTQSQAFSWVYVLRGNLLYLVAGSMSKILVYDLNMHTYSVKKIGEYSFGYFGMVYDGKYFWLSAQTENCIVRWDDISGECQKYDYPVENLGNTERMHTALVDDGENLILFCDVERTIMKMNKETGECSGNLYMRKNDRTIGSVLGNPNIGFGYVKEIDDNVIASFNSYDYSINLYEKSTGEYKEYICRMSTDALYRYEEEMIDEICLSKNAPFHVAEIGTGLTEFLDYITNRKSGYYKAEQDLYNFLTEYTLGHSGQSIHEYIRSLVN